MNTRIALNFSFYRQLWLFFNTVQFLLAIGMICQAMGVIWPLFTWSPTRGSNQTQIKETRWLLCAERLIWHLLSWGVIKRVLVQISLLFTEGLAKQVDSGSQNQWHLPDIHSFSWGRLRISFKMHPSNHPSGKFVIFLFCGRVQGETDLPMWCPFIFNDDHWWSVCGPLLTHVPSAKHTFCWMNQHCQCHYFTWLDTKDEITQIPHNIQAPGLKCCLWPQTDNIHHQLYCKVTLSFDECVNATVST